MADTAPSRRRHLVRRLGGFGSSVVINGVISLAVVPIVITQAGADLWAGIAVAQSIASFVAVVVTFGWAVTGPATVAGLSDEERSGYFRASVAARVWLAVPSVPIMIGAVILLAPGDRLADVLAALALLLPALGSSWFFVGEGSPRRLLLNETVPRAAGTALGALLLLTTHLPLEVFAGGQALGAVAAVALGWRSVLRRYPGRLRFDLRADVHRLRGQTGGVVTAVTAALYVNLPVVLAGVLLPNQVAVYAVVDKLQKLALTALGPVFQVTQGSVGSADPVLRPARARSVGRVALVLGAAVALGFALLGGLGVQILSSGRISVPPLLVAALGVALGAVSTSAIIGLSCLTALGAVKQVAVSTVLGAIVGIPAILVGGILFGVTGIAIAAALSEVVVAVYQVQVLRRRIGASERGSDVSPLLGSPTS
ncbi:polysaccharide biosynthesis C-terminal domain-containing protein [Amnibacterium kyonggiense]|uniref:O-antigen/teichoic acid export membrane protein n=1 Tax=Amnibacterium kyonggiense TaxID=595671 RepID=A0A4R7FIQ9_9MICO|nr:polysaccharide biosynthesis C-terminal domain-containing protein [Amnibacterium kyonggiense]TDS74948.1 O-antigen/teichoic acid export membrane protein [Amnibacterium kyonggiense]